MKRIIAFVLAAILLLFTLTACGKKVITDEEGNTHVLVTRRGAGAGRKRQPYRKGHE